MQSAAKRKSSLALGVFVIAILFTVETVVADRISPNPLSPWVWSALGGVAVVSLALFFWFGAKAKRGDE